MSRVNSSARAAVRSAATGPPVCCELHCKFCFFFRPYGFSKAELIGNMEQLTQASDGSTSCLQYTHKDSGAHVTSCPCALTHARHDWLPKLEMVHLHLLCNWYDDRLMMLLFFIFAVSALRGPPVGLPYFYPRFIAANNDHNYIVQNKSFRQ